MTEATITTLVGSVLAAIPATLIAYATLRQSLKIAVKADEIHVLANANLARMTTSLEIAQAKITGLERHLMANASDKKVADDLAAAKSPTV